MEMQQKDGLSSFFSTMASPSPLESFGRTLHIVGRRTKRGLASDSPVTPGGSESPASPIPLLISPSSHALSESPSSPGLNFELNVNKKQKLDSSGRLLDDVYRDFYNGFIDQYRRQNEQLLLDFHQLNPRHRLRPTITSVIVVGRVGSLLSLPQLARKLFRVETRNELLVWVEPLTQTNCEINTRGDIRTCGTDNIENAIFATTMCFYHVKKIHNNNLGRHPKKNRIDQLQELEIVDVTAKVEIGFAIHLSDFYNQFPSVKKHHPSDTLEYDTERHAFLLYYYFRDTLIGLPSVVTISSPSNKEPEKEKEKEAMKKRVKNQYVNISIYPHGKVIIKGAETPHEINAIWEFLADILPQYQNKETYPLAPPPLCLFCNLPEHSDLSHCPLVNSDHIPTFPLQESDLELVDPLLLNKTDLLF